MYKNLPTVTVRSIFTLWIAAVVAVLFTASVQGAQIYTVSDYLGYRAIPSLSDGDTLIIDTPEAPESQRIIEVVGTNVTIRGNGSALQGIAINVNVADAELILDNFCFEPEPGKVDLPAISFVKGGTLTLRNGSRVTGARGLTVEGYGETAKGGDCVVNKGVGDLRIFGDVQGQKIPSITGGAAGEATVPSEDNRGILSGGAGISNPVGAVILSNEIAVAGGDGGYNVIYEDNAPGGMGGAGIKAKSLNINGQGRISGGNGGQGRRGGSGGPGVSVDADVTVLAKTSITGGNGGNGESGGGPGQAAVLCGENIIAHGMLTASGGNSTGDATGGDGIKARFVSLLDEARIIGGGGQTGGNGIVIEERATYSENSTVSGGGNGGLDVANSKLRQMVTHTVTFDTAGGTMPNPKVYKVTAAKDSALFGPVPAKITRPGYIFVEWGRAQLGGGRFASDSVISDDITVMAKWIIGEDVYEHPENIPIRFSDGSEVALPKADVDTGFYTVALPKGGGTAYIPMTLLPYAQNLINVYCSFNLVSDIGNVIVPIDSILESEEYGQVMSDYSAQPGEIDLAVRISGEPATSEVFISRASTRERLGDFRNLTFTFIVGESKSSESFRDVAESHWAKRFIDYSAQKGFVAGVGDGKFEPERSVTRAEFVQMIVRAVSPEPQPSYGRREYTDVNQSQWFYEGVNTAKAAGLLDSFGEGSFYPNQAITREEMAGILARVIAQKGIPMDDVNVDLRDLFKDSMQIDPLYENDIRDVYRAGIMSGTGEAFDPKGATTRAQAATVLYGLNGALPQTSTLRGDEPRAAYGSEAAAYGGRAAA